MNLNQNSYSSENSLKDDRILFFPQSQFLSSHRQQYQSQSQFIPDFSKQPFAQIENSTQDQYSNPTLEHSNLFSQFQFHFPSQSNHTQFSNSFRSVRSQSQTLTPIISHVEQPISPKQHSPHFSGLSDFKKGILALISRFDQFNHEDGNDAASQKHINRPTICPIFNNQQTHIQNSFDQINSFSQIVLHSSNQTPNEHVESSSQSSTPTQNEDISFICQSQYSPKFLSQTQNPEEIITESQNIEISFPSLSEFFDHYNFSQNSQNSLSASTNHHESTNSSSLENFSKFLFFSIT